MREVSLAAARREIVAAQGFRTRRRTASLRDVIAVVERLGCVQIDAVSTVDRAQRLTLAVRAGKLPERVHDRLLASGRVFEYWAHEASLIPSADYRYHRASMHEFGARTWTRRQLETHPELVERVLAIVQERGPVSSRDFGGAGQGYWNWTPAKGVLEALWTVGRLAIAGRHGVERRYDLPERVLPDEVLGAAEPGEQERLQYLIARTVAARGLVREARLYDYYRITGGRRRLQPAMDALVEQGVCERVRLAGDGGPALVVGGTADRLGETAPRGAFLLAPFDNLLWDRIDSAITFAFEHSIEIYKRSHERVWGYYVLPLVDGCEVVGRVDTKADRQAGVLRALQVHWQGRPRPRALREALARLAWSLGLPATEVQGGVRDARDPRGAGA